MSRRYVVRPAADRDIDEISGYLEENAGIDISLQFISEVYAAFALLATQPEMGWRLKSRFANHEVRVFRVSSRFSDYLILYHLCFGRLEIVRVVHGSRDLETFDENQ